jgi:biopolymer transport protein ExbB/TolQ
MFEDIASYTAQNLDVAVFYGLGAAASTTLYRTIREQDRLKNEMADLEEDELEERFQESKPENYDEWNAVRKTLHDAKNPETMQAERELEHRRRRQEDSEYRFNENGDRNRHF